MVPNLKSLSNLFVALFLDACDTPPARITLDIDATDVETHLGSSPATETAGVSVRSGRGMGPVKRISHVEARPHKVLSFCW